MLPPITIMQAACDEFGVTINNIRSPSRTRSCSEPRKIAAYLVRKHTILSLKEIGSLFGRRDHTTVIYWLRYCKMEVEKSMMFRSIVTKIDNKILQMQSHIDGLADPNFNSPGPNET